MIWIIYLDNGQRYEERDIDAVLACATEQEAKDVCAAWEAWQDGAILPEDQRGRSDNAVEKRHAWVKANPPPFGIVCFEVTDYSVSYASLPTWAEVKR